MSRIQVNVGGVRIGGGAPISIQSMTNTDTRNAEATVKQILELENAGCEIVRSSVYDDRCVEVLPPLAYGQIRSMTLMPVSRISVEEESSAYAGGVR